LGTLEGVKDFPLSVNFGVSGHDSCVVTDHIPNERIKCENGSHRENDPARCHEYLHPIRHDSLPEASTPWDPLVNSVAE
jgi:hypothetical protein